MNFYYFQPVFTEGGHYSSDLYTKEVIKTIQTHPDGKPLFLYLPYQNVHLPLQAPSEWIDKCKYIKDDNRRIFAAMLACLDDSVGKLSLNFKTFKYLFNVFTNISYRCVTCKSS